MTFDTYGYLTPYQLIPTDLAAIELVFVEQLPESTTRPQIFAAFTDYVNELQTALDSLLEIWVNGSFTTLTLNPKDIDFVIFVDRQVAMTHQRSIRQFRQRRYSKQSVTDGYFVEVVANNHTDYHIYQLNRADKHRDLGFDRLGNPKGYLQLLV